MFMFFMPDVYFLSLSISKSAIYRQSVKFVLLPYFDVSRTFSTEEIVELFSYMRTLPSSTREWRKNWKRCEKWLRTLIREQEIAWIFCLGQVRATDSRSRPFVMIFLCNSFQLSVTKAVYMEEIYVLENQEVILQNDNHFLLIFLTCLPSFRHPYWVVIAI